MTASIVAQLLSHTRQRSGQRPFGTAGETEKGSTNWIMRRYHQFKGQELNKSNNNQDCCQGKVPACEFSFILKIIILLGD